LYVARQWRRALFEARSDVRLASEEQGYKRGCALHRKFGT
jgi:hypothetical protein